MPANLENANKFCWMRQIEIRLFSQLKNAKIVYGGTSDSQLNIEVKGNKYLSVLLSAIIGLIPNCSSSVIITELFLNGGLNFGALVSGLCVNAGLGFMYLLKNKNTRTNGVKLLVTLFLFSLAIGYITLFISLLF